MNREWKWTSLKTAFFGMHEWVQRKDKRDRRHPNNSSCQMVMHGPISEIGRWWCRFVVCIWNLQVHDPEFLTTRWQRNRFPKEHDQNSEEDQILRESPRNSLCILIGINSIGDSNGSDINAIHLIWVEFTVSAGFQIWTRVVFEIRLDFGCAWLALPKNYIFIY